MRRGLLEFAKIFIVVLCVIAILAAVIAIIHGSSFTWSLAIAFLAGGLTTLAVAALMGSGYAGAGYYKSPMMALSSTYMDTIVREYPQQRKGEFNSLIFGSILGGLLVTIGAILLYLS